jgi:hypothetical protein
MIPNLAHQVAAARCPAPYQNLTVDSGSLRLYFASASQSPSHHPVRNVICSIQYILEEDDNDLKL